MRPHADVTPRLGTRVAGDFLAEYLVHFYRVGEGPQAKQEDPALCAPGSSALHLCKEWQAGGPNNHRRESAVLGAEHSQTSMQHSQWFCGGSSSVPANDLQPRPSQPSQMVGHPDG